MKVFTGKVISKKMDKTATVAVERVIVHPVYKKRRRTDRKYHVHDEIGSHVGDIIKFVASKPYSKSKKWILTEIAKTKVKSEETKQDNKSKVKKVSKKK